MSGWLILFLLVILEKLFGSDDLLIGFFKYNQIFVER